MQITAKKIASLIEGTIEGNPDVLVHAPSKIEEGKKGTITFLGNPKYESYLYETEATIVLVSNDFVLKHPIKATIVRVKDVYMALSILMSAFDGKSQLTKKVSKLSSIDDSVKIGDNVAIDDFVIIKKGATIGNDCNIHGQVYVGEGVTIGLRVTIHPGAKIYHGSVIGDDVIIHANAVIGSDGFGFAPDGNGNFKKIPQTGNVIIESDVEIGSNTVIDRASIGSTLIKKGAKLDNLIQIAHNVTIGSGTAIAAQTGIAGSSKIGDGCLIGGQVGMAGHLELANGTMVQAQSGIGSNIKTPNTKLYGSPAIDYTNYLKSYTYFKQLPMLAKEIAALKKELASLRTAQNDL